MQSPFPRHSISSLPPINGHSVTVLVSQSSVEDYVPVNREFLEKHREEFQDDIISQYKSLPFIPAMKGRCASRAQSALDKFRTSVSYDKVSASVTEFKTTIPSAMITSNEITHNSPREFVKSRTPRALPSVIDEQYHPLTNSDPIQPKSSGKLTVNTTPASSSPRKKVKKTKKKPIQSPSPKEVSPIQRIIDNIQMQAKLNQ